MNVSPRGRTRNMLVAIDAFSHSGTGSEYERPLLRGLANFGRWFVTGRLSPYWIKTYGLSQKYEAESRKLVDRMTVDIDALDWGRFSGIIYDRQHIVTCSHCLPVTLMEELSIQVSVDISHGSRKGRAYLVGRNKTEDVVVLRRDCPLDKVDLSFRDLVMEYSASPWKEQFRSKNHFWSPVNRYRGYLLKKFLTLGQETEPYNLLRTHNDRCAFIRKRAGKFAAIGKINARPGTSGSLVINSSIYGIQVLGMYQGFFGWKVPCTDIPIVSFVGLGINSERLIKIADQIIEKERK